MQFKQFCLESLGHASYFIGLEQTGEALVLDVRRTKEVHSGSILRKGKNLHFMSLKTAILSKRKFK